MIRFKKFITLMEGGNVIGKVHKIQAAPFSNEHRSMIQDHMIVALTAFHNYVHKESGGQIHLFGPNAAALHLDADEAAFTGSSKHFMNRAMSNEQYNKLKPEGMTGDIDVQYMPHPQIRRILVPKSKPPKIINGVKHIEFEGGIQAGTKFGRFRVADSTSAGDTDHFVLHHEDFPHLRLQLDLEQSALPWIANQQGVMIPGNHNTDVVSSDASDSLHPEGPFKGVHHKHIIGLAAKAHPDNLKYAMKGLKPKQADGHEVGITTHEDVAQRLFGVRDRKKMSSFTGVVDLIKTHYTPEQHRAILDNAENKEYGLPDHVKAYLHKHLGAPEAKAKSVKLTEEVEEGHHVHVGFVGSGLVHQGHKRDITANMNPKAYSRAVGLGKGMSGVFTPKELEHIARMQSGDPQIDFKVEDGIGQTIGRAVEKIPEGEPYQLHIHLGEDRMEPVPYKKKPGSGPSFADNLQKGIETGRIKELKGRLPTEIVFHTPKEKRMYSGTEMRTAAHKAYRAHVEGDAAAYKLHSDTFSKYMPNFSPEHRQEIMHRIGQAIDQGVIKLKRPG